MQLGRDCGLAVHGSGKNSKEQEKRRQVTVRWSGADDSSGKDGQGENRCKRTAVQADIEQVGFAGPSALLAYFCGNL